MGYDELIDRVVLFYVKTQNLDFVFSLWSICGCKKTLVYWHLVNFSINV